MPEGGVTQIMRETNRLDQILIGAEGTRQRPTDMSNFQCVGEASPKVIAFVIDEDLSLVFESSKRCGVDNAVAVKLKGRAVFRLVIQIGAAF